MVIPQQQAAVVLLGLGWPSIPKSSWSRGCSGGRKVLRQHLCWFYSRQGAGMDICILCKKRDPEQLWPYCHLIWQCLFAFFCCFHSGLRMPSDITNTAHNCHTAGQIKPVIQYLSPKLPCAHLFINSCFAFWISSWLVSLGVSLLKIKTQTD